MGSAASPAPACSPASTPSRASTSRGEWETKQTRKQHTDSTSPPEPFYEDLMMLTACHVLVCNCAEKQPNIQFVVHRCSISDASTLFPLMIIQENDLRAIRVTRSVK